MVTSKNTSINTLNRVYKDIVGKYPKGTVILDYGCGKFSTNKEYAENNGFIWYGYDPGWKTDEENAEALNCNPDIIICSNVLNVVDDDTMFDILRETSDYKVPVYYTIYEGDKSNVGKETSKGYQRNEKVSEYIGYFEMLFGDINRTGNVVYCN